MPKRGDFCQFFASFVGCFGVVLELSIVLGEEELFGFQVFDKRSGTVGQLGQLKISIIQNAPIAIYPYN